MTSAGDDMLTWVSEVGSGRWNELRDVSAHLNRRLDKPTYVSDLPRKLMLLGHINLDWETGEWSVAQPALNVAPGMGLCVFLSGSRPKYIVDRWEEELDDLSVYPFDIAQDPSPTARFLKCESFTYVQDLADRMGVGLNIDPSRSLVGVFMDTAFPSRVAAESPRTDIDTLEYWSVVTRRWASASSVQSPGLYRFEVFGRKVHRLLDDHQWYGVDQPSGQFLELIRVGATAIRWSKVDGGVLEVDQGVQLPELLEVALIASCGLLPRVDRDRRKRIYRNVSYPAARAIGEKLNQDVFEDQEDG